MADDEYDTDDLTEDDEREYDTITLKQPILGWDPYILITIDVADNSAELDMSLGREATEEVARLLFRHAKRGLKQAERQMMERFKAVRRGQAPSGASS